MDILGDWLRNEPGADPMVELAQAEVLCRELMGAGSAVAPSPGGGGSFYERLLDLAGRFRPLLQTAPLPLPATLHFPIRRLVGILVESAGLVLLPRQIGAREHKSSAGEDFAAGMELLIEAWTLAAMARMAVPNDLWRFAHALFHSASNEQRSARLIQAYKRLLLGAAVQAEALSAREIVWVGDFLADHADLVDLISLAESVSGGFWVDPAQDMAPVAVLRRPPPAVDGLLHLTTGVLVKRISERIEWLEAIPGGALSDSPEDGPAMADEADLPLGLSRRELHGLLLRLREFWSMPPQRDQPRRSKHYEVEVCVGLKAIWDVLQRGEQRAPVQRCSVFNESPGGVAILSAGPVGEGVEAGMAVALRANPGEVWTLCIVRWIRGDRLSHLELGLQVVAEGPVPIRLGFRGTDWGELVHALLLRPMGAVRRNQAVLAPAGSCLSRRFIFVQEGKGLYVAQGRLLSLDMQTTGVELFQFEVDPYPI